MPQSTSCAAELHICCISCLLVAFSSRNICFDSGPQKHNFCSLHAAMFSFSLDFPAHLSQGQSTPSHSPPCVPPNPLAALLLSCTAQVLLLHLLFQLLPLLLLHLLLLFHLIPLLLHRIHVVVPQVVLVVVAGHLLFRQGSQAATFVQSLGRRHIDPQTPKPPCKP